MPSKELEPVELEGYLAAVATPEIADPEQVADDLVRQVLAAKSVEGLFTKGRLQSIRGALLGVPLTIRGVRWNRSSFDGREGVYAVIDAVRQDTGEVVTAGCGARSIMAALFTADRNGWFPFDARFTQPAKPTSGGYYPINMEPVES